MLHHRSFMNVEEAAKYLHSLSDDEDATAIDIALELPDDGAESDGDDPSEDIVDVDENIMLLGPKLLAKKPHIELSNRNSRMEPCLGSSKPVVLQHQEELEEITSNARKNKKPPKKRAKQHEWKKCGLAQPISRRESSEEDHRPAILHKWADEGFTPIDIFQFMWNDEVMELMREETNRYQQQKFGKELCVTVNELYQVLGILLLSGYNKVPSRRMFWSRQTDSRNLAVIQCGLSVNRFEDIIRSLHFVDNTKKPEHDRIYKVRPLFDHFNKMFKELAQAIPSKWAVDEALEPYYGCHGLKQFIRGKPVRFGYKFWCLCSTEGLVASFKLYEGRDSGHIDGLTVGESVVQMLAKGTVPVGSDGYIDNFFTSLPLLESFREANINLTGTIRKDRVKNIPLSDVRKKERGFAEIFRNAEETLTICQWNDKSDVRIATNKTDSESLTVSNCK
ncbi:piggyBac transposable element-derived protein 3-like [Macrobrachium rosenbergii]|uniref:piggyBac transposable element-derived protein 3-like n=1 Tax=Macrobrachium rosenbergii TaxID=79674 RepID=UPI0034D53C39